MKYRPDTGIGIGASLVVGITDGSNMAAVYTSTLKWTRTGSVPLLLFLLLLLHFYEVIPSVEGLETI